MNKKIMPTAMEPKDGSAVFYGYTRILQKLIIHEKLKMH